jgi:hypothetical protein
MRTSRAFVGERESRYAGQYAIALAEVTPTSSLSEQHHAASGELASHEARGGGEERRDSFSACPRARLLELLHGEERRDSLALAAGVRLLELLHADRADDSTDQADQFLSGSRAMHLGRAPLHPPFKVFLSGAASRSWVGAPPLSIHTSNSLLF